MSPLPAIVRFLRLGLLAGLLLSGGALAAEPESSSLGEVAIPQPAKPAGADACVEPVEVMRREHMNFLMHQRDATVLDGERGSKYSLTGCMDCHNPSESAQTAVRYPEPEHFCAGCHIYASVKIDCFECHADRGLAEMQQGVLDMSPGGGLSGLQTFRSYHEAGHGE